MHSLSHPLPPSASLLQMVGSSSLVLLVFLLLGVFVWQLLSQRTADGEALTIRIDCLPVLRLEVQDQGAGKVDSYGGL